MCATTMSSVEKLFSGRDPAAPAIARVSATRAAPTARRVLIVVAAPGGAHRRTYSPPSAWCTRGPRCFPNRHRVTEDMDGSTSEAAPPSESARRRARRRRCASSPDAETSLCRCPLPRDAGTPRSARAAIARPAGLLVPAGATTSARRRRTPTFERDARDQRAADLDRLHRFNALSPANRGDQQLGHRAARGTLRPTAATRPARSACRRCARRRRGARSRLEQPRPGASPDRRRQVDREVDRVRRRQHATPI